MKAVTLVLQDGTEFKGKSFGYERPVAGEVVFAIPRVLQTPVMQVS